MFQKSNSENYSSENIIPLTGTYSTQKYVQYNSVAVLTNVRKNWLYLTEDQMQLLVGCYTVDALYT